MTEYSMGWDAALECAAHLLTCGALRKDVTLAELAEHLRMIKIERESEAA